MMPYLLAPENSVGIFLEIVFTYYSEWLTASVYYLLEDMRNLCDAKTGRRPEASRNYDSKAEFWKSCSG